MSRTDIVICLVFVACEEIFLEAKARSVNTIGDLSMYTLTLLTGQMVVDIFAFLLDKKALHIEEGKATRIGRRSALHDGSRASARVHTTLTCSVIECTVISPKRLLIVMPFKLLEVIHIFAKQLQHFLA